MDRTRLMRIVIVAGVILVGVVIIYRLFLKPKTTQTNGTTGQTGSTDANGNPLVEYIPTSETVGNTLNYNYAAQGDAQQVIPLGTPPGGSQTVVVGGPGSSGQVGPTNGGGNVTLPPPIIAPGPGGVNPPPQPPVTPPATPPPSNPPTSGGGASGTPPPAPPRFTSYTVVHGDTLSAIARRYHTTVSAIYAANRATINSWAAAHHYPVDRNPVDNIFPGEPLHIPLS